MKFSAVTIAFAIGGLAAQSAVAQPVDAQQNEEQNATSDAENSGGSGEAVESFSLEDEPATREPSAEALAALEMIDTTLKKIDEEIAREGNGWQFKMGDDPLAERMRIIIPIAPAEALTREVMTRLMQANFDSALDARYAIGQNLLWGTFIHSLAGLEEAEFLSGLLQTINIVQTFGSSFTSGAIVFGGGDSQNIIKDQLEELIKERNKASST